MRLQTVAGWCGRHKPSYGYVCIDDDKYDLCDVVRNLPADEKKYIEECEGISVRIYNGSVYLNGWHLDQYDLSFGKINDDSENVSNNCLHNVPITEEQQKEIDKRFAEKQKKNAEYVALRQKEAVERQKQAEERQREAVERQKEAVARLVERQREVAEHQRQAEERQREAVERQRDAAARLVVRQREADERLREAAERQREAAIRLVVRQREAD